MERKDRSATKLDLPLGSKFSKLVLQVSINQVVSDEVGLHKEVQCEAKSERVANPFYHT